MLLRIWGLLSLVYSLSSLGGALVEVCLVWGLAADSGTDVWMSPCPGVGPVALGARKPRQERGTVPSSASASPPPVMLTVDLVVAGQQGQGQATPVLALRLTSRLSPPPPSTRVLPSLPSGEGGTASGSPGSGRPLAALCPHPAGPGTRLP